MFVGQYMRSLDQKNRLSIPAEFRAEFGSEYIICHNHIILPENGPKYTYAFIQPARLFEELMKSTPDYKRPFLSSIVRMSSADEQGRIIFPVEYKELTGINDSVLVIGDVDMLQIWSPVVFEEYSNNFSHDLE